MTEQTVTTVMYDGQFWIALVERYEADGSLWIGKHTFGPEPTWPDLHHFYLNRFDSLRFHRAEPGFRIKRNRSCEEIERNTRKSFDLYREEQRKYLAERKKAGRERRKEREGEKFRLKVEKKKRKKRGG